tara:strand:- start:442 stop:1152 length:711 start_codon:yes stop_codon:yes gene_type:complete
MDEADEDDLIAWSHDLNPDAYPQSEVFETLDEISKNRYNREIKTKLKQMYKDVFRKEVPQKQQNNLRWIFQKISLKPSIKLKKLRVYRGFNTRECRLEGILTRTTTTRSTTTNSVKNPAIDEAAIEVEAAIEDTSSDDSSSDVKTSNNFAKYLYDKQKQQRKFRKSSSSSTSSSLYNKKRKFKSSDDNKITSNLRRKLDVSTQQKQQLIQKIKYLKGLLKKCKKTFKEMDKVFNKR